MAIIRRTHNSSRPADKRAPAPKRELRKLPWQLTPRGRAVITAFTIGATLAILNDPQHSQGAE